MYRKTDSINKQEIFGCCIFNDDYGMRLRENDHCITEKYKGNNSEKPTCGSCIHWIADGCVLEGDRMGKCRA